EILGCRLPAIFIVGSYGDGLSRVAIQQCGVSYGDDACLPVDLESPARVVGQQISDGVAAYVRGFRRYADGIRVGGVFAPSVAGAIVVGRLCGRNVGNVDR